MSLTKNDLKEIKGLIDTSLEKEREFTKDLVEFSIEKAEMRIESKFDKKLDAVEGHITHQLSSVTRELHDIVETNKLFLDKIGDHEVRITKLEAKESLA